MKIISGVVLLVVSGVNIWRLETGRHSRIYINLNVIAATVAAVAGLYLLEQHSRPRRRN